MESADKIRSDKLMKIILIYIIIYIIILINIIISNVLLYNRENDFVTSWNHTRTIANCNLLSYIIYNNYTYIDMIIYHKNITTFMVFNLYDTTGLEYTISINQTCYFVSYIMASANITFAIPSLDIPFSDLTLIWFIASCSILLIPTMFCTIKNMSPFCVLSTNTQNAANNENDAYL